MIAEVGALQAGFVLTIIFGAMVTAILIVLVIVAMVRDLPGKK